MFKIIIVIIIVIIFLIILYKHCVDMYTQTQAYINKRFI